MNSIRPSVDVKNPLYCPSISATAYLRSIRRKSNALIRRPRNHRNDDKPKRPTQTRRLIQSFTRLLDKAISLDSYDDASDNEGSNGPHRLVLPYVNANLKMKHGFGGVRTDVPGSSDDDLPDYPYPIPAWEHDEDDGNNDGRGDEFGSSPLLKKNVWVRSMRDDRPAPAAFPCRAVWPLRANKRKNLDLGLNLKRKRTGTSSVSFSDIQEPSKFAKSIQSVYDRSFDVTLRRDKLSYSAAVDLSGDGCGGDTPFRLGIKSNLEDDVPVALEVRVRDLEDHLYGPRIGTESPQSIWPFTECLDSILPGVRLKERLLQLPDLSHQSIVDFLATNGYLNVRILTVLRRSEIQRIGLSESLSDANGLNFSASDLLTVFSKPNSFRFLSELSFSGTRVSDFDLTHIQHLPKLSTLLLNNTSISNEAVFLLVPLKLSLIQLSIASNPAINDDAVPALLLLSKLSFLSILDTSIDMPGLRRLARTIYDEDRIIDIEIPTVCELYVNKMQTRYVLNPRPPLITNPDVCAQLSAAALQRNLAAHAMKNSDIVVGGNKVEMAERLRMLLEVRKMDMLVREMILGTEREDDDGE